MAFIRTIADRLGEFVTSSNEDNKLQNAIISSPQALAYFRRRATLATIIPYYERSLDQELKMTWAIKGEARRQIVEIATSIRDVNAGMGEIIDGAALVTAPLEPEEEDDDDEEEE